MLFIFQRQKIPTIYKKREYIMPKKNAQNETVKRRYFDFLKHADGKSEPTIRMVEKTLLRFENFTKFANFKSFDQKQAIAYKTDLAERGLAKATILSDVTKLKRFLKWLSRQDGYKRQIKFNDVEYLSMSDKDVRAANSPLEKDFPTLAMVEDVIVKMPHSTPIEKRNRALVAACALTGIRASAMTSLKLKHFQKRRMLIVQDPREVKTKFSKLINSFILPISPNLSAIFLDWITYLETELLCSPNDPMFPKTQLTCSLETGFQADGLSRKHWTTSTPMRVIFKRAFAQAGLPSYPPHLFRNMLVKEMYDRELSIPEFKAWSMSLGHESAMTTLTSYGKLSVHDMENLIKPNRAM